MPFDTALNMIAALSRDSGVAVLEPPPSKPVARLVRPAEAVAQLTGEPVVGLDLETTSLDFLTDPIRLISLASSTGVFVIDTREAPDWPTVLGPLLSSPETLKVLHHAKFDLACLAVHGLTVSPLFDTMVAAQLVDGGRHLSTRGYFRLENIVDLVLHERLDKTLQTSDWSAERLTREQLTYAGRDASILLPLQERLSQYLDDAGLAAAAALEFSALPSFVWLEVSGAPFDADGWMLLSDTAMAKKLETEGEIRVLLGQSINLNSPIQIRRALSALGVEVGSTREEALVEIVDQHPVIPKLLEYREASKRASTYGIEFLHHVHDVSSRIHAEYRQIGASTGRTSCGRPNLQQIPRDSAYRRCFRPAKGRVLIKADLSLVELCVAADLSGDAHMTAAIRDEQDLHRITAAALFAISPEEVTSEQRSFGKAVNFGTLYGQGRRGLIELAARHALTLSDAQARQFQQRFAQTWPQLVGWQQRQLAGHGFIVRTASGRMRRLGPDAPGTVRANTPVQGTAADGFKAALALLWESRLDHPSALPVLAVHDELVIECDAEAAKDVAAWVEHCLQAGMQRYVPNVPVRVETVVAPTWAGPQ